MENHVDSTGVILDIEPVAHVLTLTINGKRLAMADIVDKQRNQLLRELIRAVVIRAVRHDDRHTISIVISADKMIARGLCSRIRRVRIILRGLQEELIAVGQMML